MGTRKKNNAKIGLTSRVDLVGHPTEHPSEAHCGSDWARASVLMLIIFLIPKLISRLKNYLMSRES